VEKLAVEVVFALEERQALLELKVEPGVSVAQVIGMSGIAAQFPAFDFDSLEVGIWGRIVSREDSVRHGDRIEIYRPLQMDPRDARRLRASAGQGN
tara:strand:+ start:956 stop:1243 length:288 start_codon:yes stop_codon:yes gene_type:complete